VDGRHPLGNTTVFYFCGHALMANPQHTALLLAVPSDPNPVSQTYTVEATVTDRAGNPPHGQRHRRAPSHRDLTG
jgi:hypothetical protein